MEVIVKSTQEIKVHLMCSACLSENRSLKLVKELYPLYYLVLSFGNVDSDENQIYEDPLKVYICWECEAVLKKILSFSRQVHNAYKLWKSSYIKSFSKVADLGGYCKIENKMKPRTQFGVSLKTTYDYCFFHGGEFFQDPLNDIKEPFFSQLQTTHILNKVSIEERCVRVEANNSDILGEFSGDIENALNINYVMRHDVKVAPKPAAKRPVKRKPAKKICEQCKPICREHDAQLPNLSKTPEEIQSFTDTSCSEHTDDISVGLAPIEQVDVPSTMFNEIILESNSLCPFIQDEVEIKTEEHQADPASVVLLDDTNSSNMFIDSSNPKPDQISPNIIIIQPHSSNKDALININSNESNNVAAQSIFVDNASGYITNNLNSVETNVIHIPSTSLLKQLGKHEVFEGKVVHKSMDMTENKSPYLTYYVSEYEMYLSRAQQKETSPYLEAIHKCEMCILPFESAEQLTDHFTTVHKEIPRFTKCEICQVYHSPRNITRHRSMHYKRYKCRHCAFNTSSLATMYKHLKVEHQVLYREQKTVFSCSECTKSFPIRRQLRRHVERDHREHPQCDICKKSFVNKVTLKMHIDVRHSGPQLKVKCPHCDKMVRKVYLRTHIAIHKRAEGPPSDRCEPCNKTFRSNLMYQQHMKNSRAHASENDFLYNCPLCKRGYWKKQAMQDHFDYVHMNKCQPQKCTFCDKLLATKGGLRSHIRSMHTQRKEPVRNHVCKQCGKAFAEGKTLRMHERIHSNERPLSCDVCGDTFKQAASLYTHRKRLHNIFPKKKVVQFVFD